MSFCQYCVNFSLGQPDVFRNPIEYVLENSFPSRISEGISVSTRVTAVFFHISDIDQNLISEFQLDSRRGRLSFLKEIAEDLLSYPQDYQLFGPYWWFVRHQFSREKIFLRGWFHNSSYDKEILDQILAEDPSKMLAASLQYLRLMQQDPQPLLAEELDLHLWEVEGSCEMRQVSDAGLNRQPDLFEEIETSESSRKEFLNMPNNYIPRIWREKGNRRLQEGNAFLAYRCYRRYLSTSEDEGTKADAWLLIGLAFQSIGHHKKAVFSFSNAYRRDNQDWILAHLAEAQVESGNLREGLSLYEQLNHRVPGNPEYRQRLEILKRRTEQPVEVEELNELPFHSFHRRLV